MVKDVIKLGDVATYINGYAFKPEDRGEVGLPIIRIQDLTGNAYDLGFYDGEYPEKIEINDGDVLISWSASLGVYVWNRGRALLNQHIFKVVFDKVDIDKNYFVYAVRQKLVEMGMKTHGATMKHIVKKDFDATLIPYPSLIEQAEIATNLNKVSRVIEARKQELQLLDDLIKARFVELFGDPVIHLDKGETVKLDTIADKITVGFVGEASNEYVDEGVPYLRTQNVRVNRIDLNGLIYVSESFHNKNQKSIIHPGDVVISRVGVNRGMAAMVPDSLQEANIANCLIVGKTENINPYYLAFYMNMSFGKRPQFGASVGSAQGVVNTSILKKWEVYVPDRHMQDDFFEFAKQVDKSKVVVQKALDNTQVLFDSLMQKYFG